MAMSIDIMSGCTALGVALAASIDRVRFALQQTRAALHGDAGFGVDTLDAGGIAQAPEHSRDSRRGGRPW